MARSQNDSMLNAALNWVKDNSDKIFILASGVHPMTYASAKAHTLASVSIASTIFSLADGDVSGRKLTVGIVSAVSVTTTGSATHTALVNSTGSSVTYLTQTSAQVITAGNSLNTQAWDIEIEDSAAP